MRAAKLGLAVLAGGAVATVATLRRWAATPDLSGGPLREPDGEDRVVARPDGVQLAVREAGVGGTPVFVLAHCWTGDRRVWGPVARRLVKAGAHVVTYDHRGHGKSSLDTSEHSLEALGDDLAAVLDTVAADKVILAGHSMGGMAIQSFLHRHPEMAAARVAGLGFVATATDGQRPTVRAREVITLRLMQSPVSDVFMRSPLAPVFARFTVGRTVCSPHLDAVIEPYLATPPVARRAFLTAIYDMDFSEVLRSVRVPALVVSGTKDQLTTPQAMRRMADLLGEHARWESLPDAGHMLAQEEPDRVAGLLLELATAAIPA